MDAFAPAKSPSAPAGGRRGRLAADSGPPLPPPAPSRPDALNGLSVVITCCNDAETVAEAIRGAAEAAARIAHDYELIVIDDGSADHSADEAARFAGRGGRVRLMLHARSRGYAEAVRAGISVARMPWVLLTDARSSLDLGGLDDFLPLAPGNDLLIAWRVLRRGPAGTRAKSALWNWIVRHLLEVPVRDVDCPLKLGRRELLDRIEPIYQGAMLNAELVARARAENSRVTEVGVHQRPGAGEARSGASPPLGPATLRDLARLRRALHGRSRRRGAGALVVAALAVVAGVGWLYLLRQAGLLAAGPRLAGALPLERLARSDAQPLLRMAAAWLPAGAAAGALLGSIARPRLAAAVAGAVAVVLLTFTGAASDAIENSEQLVWWLAPQLGQAGLWAAVVLVMAGAALAAHGAARRES